MDRSIDTYTHTHTHYKTASLFICVYRMLGYMCCFRRLCTGQGVCNDISISIICICSTSTQHVVLSFLSFFFFYFQPLWWVKVISHWSHCDFNLMKNDFFKLYTCLLRSFRYILLWIAPFLLCFFPRNCLSFTYCFARTYLCIPDISPLSDICIANILSCFAFSFSSWCLLIKWNSEF